MLTRRPASRPLDVMALEIALALATAIQIGLLLWLSVATWDDRGASGAPVIGVLAVVALAVAAGWFLWLVGVNGWLLAGASGVAGLQVGFLLVLGASGEVTGVSPSMLLVSLACAVLGLLCGIFLPSPSSRRYRPAPRVRADAGAPSGAPRISPSVAQAADRYAKAAVVGVATGAAAATAGARKASRSSSKAAPAATPVADPAPGLQPRAGTPIRTTGRAGSDAPSGSGGSVRPVGAAATEAARGAGATAAPATPPSPPRSGTPVGGTPAVTPPSGTAARSTTRSGAAPRQDPGAIARSGRASIDAELSATPRAGTPRTPTSAASPGFRLVDPPKPSTSVKRPSSDGPRFSGVDRPPPPQPPRGRPVGRVGDVQQVADPGAVRPSVRSLPPTPSSPAAPPRTASPTDDTLPYQAWDPAWDPPGDDR